jgi:hypothetical protein
MTEAMEKIHMVEGRDRRGQIQALDEPQDLEGVLLLLVVRLLGQANDTQWRLPIGLSLSERLSEPMVDYPILLRRISYRTGVHCFHSRAIHSLPIPECDSASRGLA